MPAIVYPSTLPSPSAAPTASTERRMIAPAGGPFDARAVERDIRRTQQITFPPFSPTEAATFRAWYETALTYGGAWFAANWPLPDGMAAGVRRWNGELRWQFVAGNYWQVSGECEVRGRGLAPVDPYVEADIYLKFDEADASRWLDYSSARRALTILPAAGSISGQTTGALFGKGGDFAQAQGGDANSSYYYGTHSTVHADGCITFGADDFVIDFTCLRRPTSAGYAWYVLDNVNAVGGFQVLFLPASFDPTNHQLIFSGAYAQGGVGGMVTSREIRIGHTEADIGGPRRRYTFSRSGINMYAFVDGVLVASGAIFTVGDSMVATTRGFLRIGAGHQNEIGESGGGLPTQAQLTRSLDGVLDELYIAHGPGTAVTASFTPPTVPRSYL